METEVGTIGVAIASTLILAFGFWIINKITNI
jgi:hypothetical protein